MSDPIPDPKPDKPPLILQEDSRKGESRIFNMSLRGWIALILIIAYAVACLRASNAAELLKDIVIMVVSFYFGTRANKAQEPPAK